MPETDGTEDRSHVFRLPLDRCTHRGAEGGARKAPAGAIGEAAGADPACPAAPGFARIIGGALQRPDSMLYYGQRKDGI